MAVSNTTALSRVIGIEKSSAHNGEAPTCGCYTYIMGNTVGSSNLRFWNQFVEVEDFYCLGLWCADGYHRTSSIGITNINRDLVEKFRQFLIRKVGESRLKIRVYYPLGQLLNAEAFSDLARDVRAYHMRKCSQPAMQLYVNSRPLLRAFREARTRVGEIRSSEHVQAYFAGRFDGDGSVSNNMRSDCRIVYSNREEALEDSKLLQKIGMIRSKVFHYKKAGTYCLYISRFEAENFIHAIGAQSVIISSKNVNSNPVETLSFIREG